MFDRAEYLQVGTCMFENWNYNKFDGMLVPTSISTLSPRSDTKSGLGSFLHPVYLPESILAIFCPHRTKGFQWVAFFWYWGSPNTSPKNLPYIYSGGIDNA